MTTKNSSLQKGIICQDRNVSKMSYLQDKLAPKKVILEFRVDITKTMKYITKHVLPSSKPFC